MTKQAKTSLDTSTPNQTTPQSPIPLFLAGSPVFEKGYRCGTQWYQFGDHPQTPPTWSELVEFIKENMLELDREGYLPEERLIDNTGFLIGWLLGKYEQGQ